MDVAPIIARLKAQMPTGWVTIAGAAELNAAIDAVAPGVPAAYVVPLAEVAAAPDLAGIHEQRIERAFGVVMVVANQQDPRGDAAATQLETKRLAVRAALLGWAPDSSNGETVFFTSGRLAQFAQGRLWWADEFGVFTTYRSS